MANPGATLVGLQRCVIVGVWGHHVGVIQCPEGSSHKVIHEFRAYLKTRKRGVAEVVSIFQKRYPYPLIMRDSRF